MSRNLKKLSHKYEFLKLELEEIEEELERYNIEWGRLFGKYFVDRVTEFWINQETGEVRREPPTEEDEVSIKPQQPEKLRKLYKKLSTFTHPDKGGDVDDFNAVKEAYNKGDILELLKYATEFEVDYNLDESDFVLIDKVCSDLESKIENSKKNTAWRYFTGTRSNKLAVLKLVQSQYGIHIPPDEYPEDLLDSNE